MKELFESDADVCLIPAVEAKNDHLSRVLLPVLCSQANTEGGIVIIGAARASDDSIILEGLSSISKTQLLINELVSDKTKISANTIKTIRKIKEQGKDILIIEVAPASWTERPVYINSDLVRGVYSYSEGERVIADKKLITLMAKDSVDQQIDNERLEYFSELFIDYKAIERYREFHREKRPFPKWDLLDDESYLERIGAKSNGCLLRAGTLMFGTNENVSFCLYRVNNGIEERHKARNIWSFIELVLPIFDSCNDLECKNALLEAFFNSLIHADYCYGKIRVIIEDNKVTFINSGIPRSSDNSSICRNLRIMKMLYLVGYSKNKSSGLTLIKNYSQKTKFTVDYEKWETKMVIPVPIDEFAKTEVTVQEKIELEKIAQEKIEQEKSIIPSVFFPVVKLIKQAELTAEQEAKSSKQDSFEEKSSYDGDVITLLPKDLEEDASLIADIHAISYLEDIVDNKYAFISDQIDINRFTQIAADTGIEEAVISEEETIEEPVEDVDIKDGVSVVEKDEKSEETVSIEIVEDVDIEDTISIVEIIKEPDEFTLEKTVEDAFIDDDVAVAPETEKSEETLSIEVVEEVDIEDTITIEEIIKAPDEFTLEKTVEEAFIDDDVAVAEEPVQTEEIVILETIEEALVEDIVTVAEEPGQTEEIAVLERVEEALVEGALAVAEENEK
jgi:hypothetical protein